MSNKPNRYDVECEVYFVKGQTRTLWLDVWAWTAEDAMTQANVELKRRIYEVVADVARDGDGYNGVTFMGPVGIRPWTAERILARQGQ